MAWSYKTSVITAVRSLYAVFRQVMGRYCSGLPSHPALDISTVLTFTNHAGMLSESPSSNISHTAHPRNTVAWRKCFHQKPHMPSCPGAFQLLSFLTTLPQTIPSIGSTTLSLGSSDILRAQSTKSGSWGSQSPSTPITLSQNWETASADGRWIPSVPLLVPWCRHDEPCLR